MSQLLPSQARDLTSFVPAPDAGERHFNEIGRFWSALLRRRWLFAATAAGFVVAVAILTVLTPKSYTTTVRLMAGSPETANRTPDTSLPILNALVLQNGQETAETFAALAQQSGVASEVVSKLRLGISPQALLARVSVKPVVNTPLLDLSVSWNDPGTSARIANAFGDAFMNRERTFVQSQAVAALDFLNTEMPQALDRMHQTSAALANYQAANGFVDASSHTQEVVSHATAIDGKIESAMLDSREATALLNNVDRQLATLPATMSASQQISVNPVLEDLRTRLVNVDSALQQARGQYTEQHPLVVSLEKQHQALQAQIARQPAQINTQDTVAPNPVYQSLQQQAAQYRERVDGDNAQLALLRRQREQLAPVLHELPAQSMQLATLQQQAKLASDVYNALAQKYSEASIARSTALSDISIVQPATPGAAVVRPNLKVNLLVSIVIGLLLASICVAILEALEHRVRLTDADGRILGLPLIARIPAFAPVSRAMLPWVQSMTIEAFLHLCVTLRLKTKQPIRSLSISSPCRGDGKSTVAFNLAKAMATLQPRVLLIDADMRRPTLHEQAGCANKVGLSNVLEGSRSLADSVKEIAPNLDLLASGRNVQNPVLLLQGTSFDDLLRTATEHYAMVIVDTPPLGSVTDGLLVSSRVDGTALVIAENSTDETEARRVIGEFSALGINNVVGIILNMDTKKVNDYSDYFVQIANGRALPGSTT